MNALVTGALEFPVQILPPDEPGGGWGGDLSWGLMVISICFSEAGKGETT